MRLLGLAVAAGLAMAVIPVAATATPVEDEGLGPCQDAPFARPELHPRLDEHHVDGVRVLVLRPERFERGTRYPVLYLLHGSVSVPDEWVTRMGIEALTGERDVIVVMPDGGRAGLYRDWANGGRRWESFHTQRLIEWVDATYPTIAARRGRAIAGLSMGGGGAVFYAARHPDRFAAVGSFSGLPLIYGGAAEHTVGATYAFEEQQRCEEDQTGVELFGGYGNPATDEVGVRNRLPLDLAHGLRGMLVYLSAGDGVPVDDEERQLALERPETTVMEAVIRHHTDTLAARLTELGIAHTVDHLPGSHWWGTFRPALNRFVDLAFAHGFDQPHPATFDYRSADDDFTVWDWTFRITDRPAQTFTLVAGASRAGVDLHGDGVAEVTTAAYFRPNQALRVTIDGHTTNVRADRGGRLRFDARMRPDNAIGVRIEETHG